NRTGTHTDDTLIPSDFLYVDWAGTNAGAVSPSQTFYSALYLDGNSTPITTWNTPTSQAGPGANFSVEDYLLPLNLTLGRHTLTIALNYDNSVPELNNSNNSYTKTFTITDPRPHTVGTTILVHGYDLKDNSPVD